MDGWIPPKTGLPGGSRLKEDGQRAENLFVGCWRGIRRLCAGLLRIRRLFRLSPLIRREPSSSSQVPSSSNPSASSSGPRRSVHRTGNRSQLGRIDSENQQELDGGSETLSAAEIYEKEAPSIVGICVYNQGSQPGDDPAMEGSGIIISENSYIMTNSHVINDSNEFPVEVVLSTEERYVATVVGFDKRTDLAVIKIEATGLPGYPGKFRRSACRRLGIGHRKPWRTGLQQFPHPRHCFRIKLPSGQQSPIRHEIYPDRRGYQS